MGGLGRVVKMRSLDDRFKTVSRLLEQRIAALLVAGPLAFGGLVGSVATSTPAALPKTAFSEIGEHAWS